MINIYSPEEIKKIRAGGRILAEVLRKTMEKTAVGMTTAELDKFATGLIEEAGGKPSFAMEKGYHWATCLNVNDMVVHGIPNDYQLRDGDKLGIDAGVYYQGFHTDASWTVQVGTKKPEVTAFLKTGEEALAKAIASCRVGSHIGDISLAEQMTVEEAGYSCVRQLVGHGVGRKLHEDPEIPCFLRGNIKNTAEIKPGMVLAVEVIYNQGKSPVVYAGDDGWTIVTRDGSLSGLFEHTVVVGEKMATIVTGLASGEFL